MNSTQIGHKWLREILDGNVSRCFNMFQMNSDVFFRLCTDYRLKSSRRTCAIEMLGMFLYRRGQSVGNQSAMEQFQHSGETISRYFDNALDNVCRLSVDLINRWILTLLPLPKRCLKIQDLYLTLR